MKIGLYFGSFNPIHHGHLLIAGFILENTDVDQVWFIVSPQNPLKPSHSLLNEYHRLFLVQAAIEGELRLRASDVEFKLPRPSYTADTLAYLHEKYPSHHFSIIMGSDSFQNISRWKNYQYLLKNYTVYLYARPEHEQISEYPEAKSVVLLKAPLLPISATDIRKKIRDGKSIRYWVPEAVREEIERNGYYKSPA